MKTVYAVRTLPVRDAGGVIRGWVRVDVLADETSSDSLVFLRDGTACGQAEAMRRIASDLGLLYPTRDEAVREGIARLRAADAMGELQAP
jgi:hypothetical protein